MFVHTSTKTTTTLKINAMQASRQAGLESKKAARQPSLVQNHLAEHVYLSQRPFSLILSLHNMYSNTENKAVSFDDWRKMT